jgi:hypothetical protein
MQFVSKELLHGVCASGLRVRGAAARLLLRRPLLPRAQ